MNCQAWANLGATYPVADDRSSGIWSDFGTGAIPRNAIIDMNGVVRYNSVGYNESAVTGILDELLLVTGLDEEKETPKQHNLLTVFPNPFNAEAQIQFEIPRSGQVTLSIYDSQGRAVRRLLNLELSVGSHQLTWNTRDDSGSELPSGVYMVTLAHDGGRDTRKLLLLK
ncbi:MAG: T9SS type A sorting domain-containing protein [FCB group bacterium]|nr:T9SS type A sorting domain-containing protein [FCB group bacterium]MBL7027150.1 T9SS type A sorting domain-containing protein [Candidatus Neomarinimicrobiota bacterium]MBL7120615.1 T9SS type A sorting domain-containing protein [Candidatus Neomarinimicrobiota bacterium]